jgi:hypothetical protein
MPVVNFAANQVMFAQYDTAMTLLTAPHPMGGNDYIEGVWNISSLDKSAGTAALVVTAMQSNDGIAWIDTSITSNQATVPADPVEINGYVRAAFIRFKYDLSVIGNPGDLVWAAFCLHVNLLQSGT